MLHLQTPKLNFFHAATTHPIFFFSVFNSAGLLLAPAEGIGQAFLCSFFFGKFRYFCVVSRKPTNFWKNKIIIPWWYIFYLDIFYFNLEFRGGTMSVTKDKGEQTVLCLILDYQPYFIVMTEWVFLVLKESSMVEYWIGKANNIK